MGVKTLVKRILEEKENIRYRRELGGKQTSYGEWAAAAEAGQEIRGGGTDSDFVLFCVGKGCLAAGAIERIGAYFAAHPEVQILYGDEDVSGGPDGPGQVSLRLQGEDARGGPDGSGKVSLRLRGEDASGRLGRGSVADRRLPWYKPDWSPELLDSFFYFGSAVAVRGGLLERAEVRPEEFGRRAEAVDPGEAAVESGAEAVYEVIDFAVYEETIHRLILLAGGYGRGACGIGHIESILFHGFHGESGEWQGTFLEASPFLERREEAWLREFRDGLAAARSGNAQSRPFLSIVIPSKDHPEVLERCLKGCLLGAEPLPIEESAMGGGFVPIGESAMGGGSVPVGESVMRGGSVPVGGAVLKGEPVPVGGTLPEEASHGAVPMTEVSSAERALPFEVIVVDNGSSAENRERTERMLREMECAGSAGCRVRYLYRPMEFNFSKMCNLGAAEAEGDFLLFLNDDVELCRAGTLERMAAMAAKDGVGAVGLKLYYPDSRRIQHAGITNLPMGPVHKLQFQEDDRVYYYGANQGDHNVLAVTAACLMVGRDKYQEVMGFPEELRVAFNDVDFCFSLYEAGYRNVCMNGLHAYHHESLSRGDDESAEKLDRLAGEREKLYRRHPRLEGKDPYYAKGLSREGLDTGIRPAYLTARNVTQRAAAPLTVIGPASAVPSPNGLDSTVTPAIAPETALCLRIGKMPWDSRIAGDGYRMDACVMLRVEDCCGGRVLGYGVVLGDNNACYDRTLLLWEDRSAEPEKGLEVGRIYALQVEGMYRPDLEENMPDQKNVALCGFDVEIGREAVPAGKYRLGMAVRNRITGLGLLNWSNRFMAV